MLKKKATPSRSLKPMAVFKTDPIDPGRAIRLPAALMLMALSLVLLAPPAAIAGKWAFTGSMQAPRMSHTLTRLADGRVLAAGGGNSSSSYLRSCELYDPTTGNWTPTGDLNIGRNSHTATLLPDGKVLVAGGSSSYGPTDSAELFDPTAKGGVGAWTSTGNLNYSRSLHTCTLLPDGKVLAVGGNGGSGSLEYCELFDPAADGGVGAWTPTGALHTARQLHTATLLPNGAVLVEGGRNWGLSPSYLDSYEIYNGSTWTPMGSLASAHADEHTATRLADGRVLVAGGFDGSQITATTELYEDGEWKSPGSMNEPRYMHAAAPLLNGKALVVGGVTTGGTCLTSAEIYYPSLNSWSLTDSLNTARKTFAAVLLTNGKVLVAGGDNGSGVALQTAELYTYPYKPNQGGPLAYFAGTGHWYRAFTFSAQEVAQGDNTWEDAKAKAIRLGGYLATATTEAENNFIVNLVKEDKFWWIPGDPDTQHAQGPWLGASQDYQNEATLIIGPDDESTYYVWNSNGQHVYADEAWKWVTAESWSYYNWADLEPNDYPYYEELPAFERGHANYLHYFNRYYDPTDPASTRWAATWEDSTLDNGGRTLGYIVEWDQKPRLPSGPGAMLLLLHD
jgi:hypothetical protein